MSSFSTVIHVVKSIQKRDKLIEFLLGDAVLRI